MGDYDSGIILLVSSISIIFFQIFFFISVEIGIISEIQFLITAFACIIIQLILLFVATILYREFTKRSYH